MTARDLLPVSTPINPSNVPAQNATDGELNRKRSAYLDFLSDWLLPSHSQQVSNTIEEDQLLAELFRGSQGPPAEVINDLPGVLNVRAPAATPASYGLDNWCTASPEAAAAAQTQALTPTAAAASGRPPHHRAVTTAMPMPATTRAGHAGADDDDTSSQVTMPMPARKRPRSEEEDEACSSPNDLVEVPAAQSAAARKRQHAAAAAAGGTTAQHDASSSKRDQSGASSAAAGSAAVASNPDVHKGILVAKVLTKSDSNSKRIILPRIAVETNLPQLSSAPHFHLTATDPAGAAWPLVIKAWANGSNPKPVYVLEMIGDVLKQYKLSIGDAIALLADEQGNFYLEWNTQAAAAAAARPTYSGIVFKPKGDSSSNALTQQQQPAAVKVEHDDTPAAAAPQQQQQQSQAASPAARNAPVASPFAAVELAHAAATAAAAAAPAADNASAQAPAAVAITQEQPEAAAAVECDGPVTASQQQQLFQQLPVSANMPLMTAIPVTSPQVPGTFIPTSPCQLLVVGHLPMPSDLDLDLDGALQPSLPSGLLGNLNSNGDVVMPPGPAAYNSGYGASGLETATTAENEALLVPTGAMPQLAHSGGVLLCPRTPGCTRPAGHQGWCLGHKGYKKRRV